MAIGGYTTLSKVYAYEPVPEELTTKQSKHILGAQANVWAEYLKKPENVTYMVLPRMAALSEVLWSPAKSRNWDNFYDRLPAHFQRYEALGLNYSLAVNQIKVEKIIRPDSVTQLTLKTEVPNGVIYYTTDGSDPDTLSVRFDQPLDQTDFDQLKMQLYRNGQKIGDIQQRVMSISSDK